MEKKVTQFRKVSKPLTQYIDRLYERIHEFGGKINRTSSSSISLNSLFDKLSEKESNNCSDTELIRAIANTKIVIFRKFYAYYLQLIELYIEKIEQKLENYSPAVFEAVLPKVKDSLEALDFDNLSEDLKARISDIDEDTVVDKKLLDYFKNVESTMRRGLKNIEKKQNELKREQFIYRIKNWVYAVSAACMLITFIVTCVNCYFNYQTNERNVLKAKQEDINKPKIM